MPIAIPSSVRVANMALGHLGISRTIETFDENVPEAKQMKLWYDYARLQALEVYNWSFARKRQLLALHGDDPPEGVWQFRYQYPSDCVRMRLIENTAGPNAAPIPFEVEVSDDGTKSVLTNLETAKGIYTFDVTDSTQFSPVFGVVCSHLLAYYAAMPLTKKLAIQQQQLSAYLAALRFLPGHDANESMQAPPPDAPWISGSGR